VLIRSGRSGRTADRKGGGPRYTLETLGVENQFVVYPNEGHSISDIVHRHDIMQRALAWYDRHLK
jgi:hypothetical protein